MTDGNSVEHLSVVMTTQTADDVTQTTGANADNTYTGVIGFYFQCAVVAIGVVGTVANAVILYALVASKQHKKHVLIFYQNVLDFGSSLLLIITASVKLYYFHSKGSDGYWLCVLIRSEYLNWVVILASKINLISVTIERCLKVVYSVWSKKKLRNWMTYLAMAFALISGFANMTGTVFATTNVIDGACYAYVFWKTLASLIAYRIFHFLYFYVVILIIFIFCYWRILVVIRRQARVMARHGSSTAQTHSQEIQTNVIKTMIIVSAFFAICDLPMNLHFLLTLVRDPALSRVNTVLYYASMFMSFLYICANPFIYATKFDPVKRVLQSLIPCKMASVEPNESIEVATHSTAAKRSGQAQNCQTDESV